MDKKLIDILNNNEDNYIFPFFWQRGDHTDKIPEQLRAIYDSGCKAVCIESRPHPDFCGEAWWRDMDIILSEAKKLDMKVWLLDDDRFPTGHAAGWIEKKHPELRQWELVENHIDVAGPMQDGSVIFEKENPDHILLGAYAYKRNYDEAQTCTGEIIDLNEKIDKENGYINFDVPEGVWRIFCYYKSRRGSNQGYIDTINAESVRVLIDAVYEPHYERYKEYFGTTLVGFFSDEPQLGNRLYGFPGANKGFYEERVGTAALAYPWNENVLNRMEEYLGYSPLKHLHLLWFEDGANGDKQSEIRFAYMNAVMNLYSECFTKQLAAWAEEHNVMYIGHIIEDMNCHMGAGVGHYFKALSSQHMSGMDIVLHQVMPGMEHLKHTAECIDGVFGGEFFHYTLGKLCASLAHLTPHMKSRAMCEVFGAYGYGEDSTIMKYLIDFLLVRGINHFVPHAFSTKYPDGDCPPHFGACGKDPSFEAFSKLMKYTNKAAHLLYGATHIANVALLYHMDNEWASRFENAMTCEPAGVCLYDSHIDYDIVSSDMLENAVISNGEMQLSEESFKCLVIPYADHVSNKMKFTLSKIINKGLPVIFIDALPENFTAVMEDGCEKEILSYDNVKVVKISELALEIEKMGIQEIQIDNDNPLLRIYHCKRGDSDIFMFVNEDIAKNISAKIKLPCKGEYIRLDLLSDVKVMGCSKAGELDLQLSPTQSQIVVFTDAKEEKDFKGLPDEKEYEIVKTESITPAYSLELAYFNDLSKFEKIGEFTEFFNITSPKFKPDFAGKMRYTFDVEIEKNGKHILLDLGRVGQNAEISVNGVNLGMRISKPYVFDIASVAKNGSNTVCVTVSNTLVRNTPDVFSKKLLLSPSGLLGNMQIKYTK